ncbi:DMT family transporter [Undibacterium arcticum]
MSTRFGFTLIRYTGAAALLLVILYSRGEVRWQLLRQHWVRLLYYGILGYGMFGILVFVGLDHSVPSHGAVIMATMPVTTLFLRWAFERQRPQWWAWGVVSLTIVGVVLVSGVLSAPTASGGHTATIYGDLVALFGTLGWVTYTRGQGKLPQLSVIEYTAFTAVLALPALFLLAVLATMIGWAHQPSVDNLVHVAPAMAYIVVVATVLAALAFNKGVRQLGATQGIVFINFVPVSALAISAFRGSMPHAMEIAGTLLVVCALLIQARLTRPRPA